jgi:hypothetical protein
MVLSHLLYLALNAPSARPRYSSSKPPASRIVLRPPAQAWTAYGPRFKEGLALPHAPLMQLPAHLVASRSLHRLPTLPTLPVALHRGPNGANSALDAFHSLLGAATRGGLAELTHPQRSHVLRKA